MYDIFSGKSSPDISRVFTLKCVKWHMLLAQKSYILNDSGTKNLTLVTQFLYYYLETNLFIFLKYEM
jgi:hypothetical protein